jgi:plastocyanin
VGAAEAGGECRLTAMTAGDGATADTRNCFEPVVLTVKVGERVTWTNRGETPHTVTGASGLWGSYDELGKDQAVSFAFDEPGVFPYACVLHPTMVGAVVVTEKAGPISVPELVGTERDPDEAESSAIATDEDEGPSAAHAVGGVGFGLLAGVGASAGWRRWRLTRP